MTSPEADHLIDFIPAVNPQFTFRGEDEKAQEECGATGILSKTGEDVAYIVPSMQNHLRHRGVDSAGLVVYRSGEDTDRGELITYKGAGRPRDVFPDDFNFSEYSLVGSVAAGHNRYGTSGGHNKDNLDNASPMESSWNGRKMAVNFNGNLAEKVRDFLRSKIPSDLLKDRDRGIDANDLVDAIVSAEGSDDVEMIKNGLDGVPMAYSMTILTDLGRLFALRGPSGTWPMWVGETDNEIIFSSETRVAKAKALGGRRVNWREVKPGELVEATPDGVISTQLFEPVKESICMLHAVYGARGDSLFTENATFYDLRRNLGRQLAREHPIEADVYIGIPTTGQHIGVGYVEELGKELTDVIKLRHDERSYIAKNPDEAARIVNGKFMIEDPDLVRGKSVVAIEDSFIKGTTAGGDPEKQLLGFVEMLRIAGADKVHLLAALPKFTDNCDLGYVVIKDTLVAVMKQADGTYVYLTEKEIAQRLGADSFAVISMEGMNGVVEDMTGRKDITCTACMGGDHPLNAHPEILEFTDEKSDLVLVS